MPKVTRLVSVSPRHLAQRLCQEWGLSGQGVIRTPVWASLERFRCLGCGAHAWAHPLHMALGRWLWAACVPHNSGAPGREVGTEGHWGSLCWEVFSPGVQGAG